MAALPSDAILKRLPELALRLDSSNQVRIYVQDSWFECGPHALAVLSAFSAPRSVADALRELEVRTVGIQDWVDLMDTVVGLYGAGILQDEGAGPPADGTGRIGFGAPAVHGRMLGDRTRTASFLAAVREVVRPGDVVVDIGTGTGILAIAAAQSGARRVYAIEASMIADVAQSMFEANGVADRVTLLRGWSTRIDLPERADVLVSEILGNDPLAENVLETTGDALKRLLKPGARLVPGRVRVFGLPVSIPRGRLAGSGVSRHTLQEWGTSYGIDFGPLAGVDLREERFFIEPRASRHWSTLSDPVLLADVDLTAVDRVSIDSVETTVATSSGRVDGLLEYFELELGPTTHFSLHPAQVGETNHWQVPVWLPRAPLRVQAGDRLSIAYRYRTSGPRVAISRSD
ncbi:MAG: hypothetical protein QOF33_2024 [Thermomicrobiales bacterium]|jgi:protein arginine N-methyltransferase 1|nr:hypothetical protein [Thermomicrobiales bacterium]MEA2583939.1 hypothetical protein [Thermomicrobiales bacterium]